jgi:Tfp pilus assembly protein PilP
MRTTLIIPALALILGPAGCGDDPPAPRPARPKPAAPGGGGAAAQKGNIKGLDAYTKVEDLVADDEAKALRHRFVPRDFEVDTSGNENRDPFRSYVVGQPGVGATADNVTIQPTELCTAKNMVASNYSLRDLRLQGIVLRGTRSYALFVDNAGFGHIVRRDNCLGKEKALVEKIGAGFVRLEILPDPSPNAAPLPPQKREIQLYPEELQIEDPADDIVDPSPGAQPAQTDDTGG